MTKKILLAVASLILLAIVFLTTEEKKDFLTEETYWKKDITALDYIPPAQEWKGDANHLFIPNRMRIQKTGTGMGNSPVFFSVMGMDEAGKVIYQYEAGYNAKNTFTELGLLKVKSVAPWEDRFEKDFQIETGSPKIVLSEGKSQNEIRVGKEIVDKSLYSFSDGKYLLSSDAHTLRRFKTSAVSFRERNLVYTGEAWVSRIRFKNLAGLLEAENNPYQDEFGNRKGNWRRNTGTKLVFDPNLGAEWEAQLKNLRYDLFPDDENGEGWDVIGALVKGMPVDQEWELSYSDGRVVKILLFPKTTIKDKEFRPALRTLPGQWAESPAYVSHDIAERLVDISDKIRKADHWQKSEKKLR